MRGESPGGGQIRVKNVLQSEVCLHLRVIIWVVGSQTLKIK